jgi:DNA-binding response OmpR family regulator/tRNA A-37 threonylcarbamoyl transferase component Bud32
MARIVVVDDDDLIRLTVTRVLRARGHEVLEAVNGLDGFDLIERCEPALVISDVNMPGEDGFSMLERLRAKENTRTLPVIMLTSLDDRGSFRRGMTLGADDYLPKPFSRDELLAAVDARLQKADALTRRLETQLAQREQALREQFARRLQGRVDTDSMGNQALTGVAEQALTGVVLQCEIRNFTGFAERLTSAELADLLSEFLRRASEVLSQWGGEQLCFEGEGLLAVFPAKQIDYALRAGRAALELALVARALRILIGERHPDRGLPELVIGAGLATGEVQLLRMSDGAAPRLVGDPVRLATQLNRAGEALGHAATVSEALCRVLGTHALFGEMRTIQIPGRSLAVQAAELRAVSGIRPNRSQGEAGGSALLEALRENARATARAVKQAYSDNLERLRQASQGAEHGYVFRGYRVERKIGSGGMSDVFLATRERDEQQVVLKVLDMRSEKKRHLLSRFIQEYNLVSRIEHPNVVRIFDQGITEDHAFIAMEYMDGGDLRALVKSRPAPEQVLDLVLQAAKALQAIHEHGIVHRDLKPENLMMRSDGSVALADFGIAKGETSAHLTHHDHIVGTPYYISPEQASTGRVDARSDLYSLGVILYEMLVGSKPYRGSTIAAIIGLHINGPLPRLPQGLELYQPLINRLMAKNPEDRYADAQALIRDLEAYLSAERSRH